MIREALRANGINFEVEHYDTADAGVRVVRRYQPDSATLPQLILLDYNLPGGTARDILRAVKDNPALTTAKKAVLTCSAAPQDRVEALAAGADIFLYKPADFDSFINDIGSAIAALIHSSN